MRKYRILSFLLILMMVVSTMCISGVSKTKAATVKVKYGGKVYTYGTKKQTTAVVNGKKISSNMPGIIVKDINLLPIKVFKEESLGITYSYNSSKKLVTFKKSGVTVKLTLGSKVAKVNNKNMTMSVGPERMYLYNNKTYYLMIPGRFVAEKLGFTYKWINEKRQCTINKKEVATTNKPTSTNTIKPTATPKKTEAPVKTEEEEKTEAPVKTEEVKKTEAPVKTEEVKKTEAPVKTEEAEKTEAPVKTEEAEKTEAPVKTEEAEKTEVPVKTEEVKETSLPAIPTPNISTVNPVSTVSTGAVTNTVVPTATPVATAKPTPTPTAKVEEEMKAMWISYLEFDATKQLNETNFKKKMNTIFNNCASYGMNTVIVQVRPFSDAMYKSSYFPWSKYASGKQGSDPGYDPLKVMVSLAHEKGLKIQAWLNPYRVTTGSTSASSLADGHPAKKWMNSTSASTKRNVLSFGGNLYYNPSKTAVRTLIVNGVKEIVKNYDVDGIHFDDYFYPSFDSSNYDSAFDAEEYDTYVDNCYENNTEPMVIESWRRGNVNKLVREVYAAVKEIDSNVVFGISPAGNIDNLLSKYKYYANVKTWMSNTNYVDYICPQIYWSFNNSVCPYAKTVDRWIDLKKSNTVKMYIGIAAYRAGSSEEAEWKNSDDVLKRQIQYGRGKKEVSGFCFYRYESFQLDRCKKELANLLPLLK